MAAQGQADRAVILDHLAAGRQGAQVDRRLDAFGGLHDVEQRHRLVAKAFELPQRFAPRQAERWQEGVGLGQAHQGRNRRATAPPGVFSRGIGHIPCQDQLGDRLGSQPLDQAHAQPQRPGPRPPPRFQGAVPARGIEAHRPDLDAMVAHVAHDLRRRIEAHGL